MMLTRNLIDLWDPDMKLRNRDKKISFLQIISFPLLITGMILTFTIDIITLPCQLRIIINGDD